MKQVVDVFHGSPPHWVGDGFPVRSLFSYQTRGPRISPFLLLDHAGPHTFEPATQPRGVGAHPHRGFETVTIVYSGEVAHYDSTGAGGLIGPGDVQWMTAAKGIVHEEFHSPAFTAQGGTLEMVQLWVNLPARDKSAPAGYQTLLNAHIPVVALPDNAGQVRVIAGRYAGQKGPAHTFTPINVWDMRLNAGHRTRLEIPAGQTAMLVVLHGRLQVNDQVAGPDRVIDLSRPDDEVVIYAEAETVALLLSGDPIEEPLAGYGPFVMNTPREITQAIEDFQQGRFLNSDPFQAQPE